MYFVKKLMVMDKALHTVLGATGGVGCAVVEELSRRGLNLRVVERTKNVPGYQVFKADLLKTEQARQAIEGSAYVYLCVGLAYDIKVWERDWPVLMKNVADACAETGAALIFLDNVYMYGPAPLAVPFDENHPQQPTTRKGKLRKSLADGLLQQFASGKLKGVIGRAADFYGPGAPNSVFYISMLERMLKGKAPQSIAKAGIPHTYAFNLDLGRALVNLALDESTYGQVWHLPVGEPLAAEEIAGLINRELGTQYRLTYLPGFIIKTLSLFVTPIREMSEMLYQFNQPYILSFEKFKNQFPGFEITANEAGVKALVAYFRGK
jgi:nucleoside-diphosphate-sugar epimerase